MIEFSFDDSSLPELPQSVTNTHDAGHGNTALK